MDIKPQTKIISGTTLSISVQQVAEYLLLFGLGIVAILLHARFRSPINIPGHHGLEFMAILMAGRLISKNKVGTTISSLGIGFMLLFPWFGFKDPFMGINYMFPGILLDVLYNASKNHQKKWFIIAMISGLAYFSIPLSRVFIHLFTGYPYSSFIKFGYAIPLINFFTFGLAGGLAGAGVIQIFQRKIRKK